MSTYIKKHDMNNLRSQNIHQKTYTYDWRFQSYFLFLDWIAHVTWVFNDTCNAKQSRFWREQKLGKLSKWWDIVKQIVNAAENIKSSSSSGK